MYQFILFSYFFLPDSIVKDKDYFIIKKNKDIFYLYEINDSHQVFMQYSYSLNYSFYDLFLVNRYHSIISKYQNSYYVLLKKRNMNISTCFPVFSSYSKISFFWYREWIKRSDYLEKVYSMIHNNYEFIDDSFDYYLGLLELSIFLLQDYQNIVGDGFLQQKKYDMLSLTNPLNIVIDVKERDFAEYLKYIFWNNQYQNINISDIIYQNRDVYDYHLVLARVLYPNYYFDEFDQVVFFHKDQSILKQYFIRSGEFRDYFHIISLEISKYCSIKKIPF